MKNVLECMKNRLIKKDDVIVMHNNHTPRTARHKPRMIIHRVILCHNYIIKYYLQKYISPQSIKYTAHVCLLLPYYIERVCHNAEINSLW